MPQLSIIVTSYNIAPFIGACLDTVLAQTITDVEIIVVDDGSTDGSADIIRSYAARDPRIRPVLFDKNTPGGVGPAANAGLEIAIGEFIGFMDGDDLCEPTMFATLVTAARRHGADLAMCRYLEQQEPGGERTEPAEQRRWLDYPSETYVPLDHVSRRDILRFIAVPWRKIYRRALLDRHSIRFPEGDFYFEDNPFHWFCVTSAEGIVLVPEVLCYHRIGRPGQTMANADERLFRIFRHFFIIRDWLSARGELALYRRDLLGWAVSQLEWVSRRTPPELHQRLFDVTAPILADYSQVDIDAVIADFGKGKRALDMTHALRRRDAAAFSAALWTAGTVQPGQRRPQRASLLREGLHHLQTYGVVSTARKTSRFLMREAQDRIGRRAPAKGPARPASATVSNSDILFALTVLERRVVREAAIRSQDISNRDILSAMTSLENRIADLEAMLKNAEKQAVPSSRTKPATVKIGITPKSRRPKSKPLGND